MIKSILYSVMLMTLPLVTTAQLKANEPSTASERSVNMTIPKVPQMTVEVAMEITTRARNYAKQAGKEISIAILDASGQTILLSRGNGVGPHNTEAARRKAYTTASTKTSTLELGRNAKLNADSQNLANLPELLLLGGGVPLFYEGQLLGAIGVAGGGGAENDDDFAKRSAKPEFSATQK